MTKVTPSFEDEFTKIRDILKEYNEDKHFVGQTLEHSIKSFHVNRNLCEGYFVAIWP